MPWDGGGIIGPNRTKFVVNLSEEPRAPDITIWNNQVALSCSMRFIRRLGEDCVATRLRSVGCDVGIDSIKSEFASDTAHRAVAGQVEQRVIVIGMVGTQRQFDALVPHNREVGV